MNIYRIDDAGSRTHSWLVTVQRRGRVYHRHFTDSVYGEKRKALDAAKVYRASLVKCLRPLTRAERCRVRKKNNRSGVSGVTRIDALEKNHGGTYHRRYWVAQWPIAAKDRSFTALPRSVGGGKARTRKFSIKRYGEQGARQRALHARRQAMKSLGKIP